MNLFKGLIARKAFMVLLFMLAAVLTARLCYFFLADAQRFPIHTVKITGRFEHVARPTIEALLAKELNGSFFAFSEKHIKRSLSALEWIADVKIERIWPDSLKIILLEKEPFVLWNDVPITQDGQSLTLSSSQLGSALPRLIGPAGQQTEVLQIYQKLSKILSACGLRAKSLRLQGNQSWELTLSNDIEIRLGKREIEQRLMRFCKAYPAVFLSRPDQQASVDLRYTRGMAVQWKQQMGR